MFENGKLSNNFGPKRKAVTRGLRNSRGEGLSVSASLQITLGWLY
jgi:hypothetical protein